MVVIIVANGVAAVLLTAVFAATGARIRYLLRLPVRPRLRLAVDATLGAGLLTGLVTALGLAGLLRAWLLAIIVLATAALGRWRWRQWRLGVLIPPMMGGTLLLPVSLAPPFFYDALIYHLGLPWQALLEGGLHAHPETIYSAAPPLFQALATVPLAFGLERTPAMLHWFAFVLAGTGVDGLARSVGTRPVFARLAAFCVPLVPLYVLVPGLPAAEGFGALAIVAALGVVLQHRAPPGSVTAAGLLLGSAVAARLQTLPLVALIGLIAVVRSRDVARSTVLLGGTALVAAWPWWLKNLLLLGHPFLPLGWRGVGIEAVWRDAVSTIHLTRSLGGMLRPMRADLGPHAAYLLPLALAALLALVRRSDARLRWLALLLVGGIAIWDLTAAIPRYLAAWALVLLVLAAAASAIRAGRWAAAMALGATAALAIVATLVHLHRVGGLRLVIAPPERVERALIVNDPLPAFKAAATLPPDAKVLFVGEPRGYGFPRRFVAPSYYDEPVLREPLERLRDAAAVRAWLTDRGFTHLLVNWAELARLAGGYPAQPFRSSAGRHRWEGLINLLGPPVIARGAVQIFAVAPH